MTIPSGVVTIIAGASKQYDWFVAFLDGDGSIEPFTSIRVSLRCRRKYFCDGCSEGEEDCEEVMEISTRQVN